MKIVQIHHPLLEWPPAQRWTSSALFYVTYLITAPLAFSRVLSSTSYCFPSCLAAQQKQYVIEDKQRLGVQVKVDYLPALIPPEKEHGYCAIN